MTAAPPASPLSVELVTIGTELLLGFTIDSNAAFIGEQLAREGIRLARRTTVGDDADAIRSAVSDALGRTGFVFTTGGLGPTRDDVTKKVLAELFDAPLEFQPALWDALVERFGRLGRTPAAANRSQAEVPRGAVVLPNARGTAPGLWLSGPAGQAVMLPGVPTEMRGLLRDQVLPRLREGGPGGGSATIRSLLLRTTGIPESSLAERIGGIEDGIAPLTLAYLPGLDGVDLRLTAWNLDAERADQLLTAAAARLEAELRDHCYGRSGSDLAALLLEEAGRRGEQLAVAESCTGGMLGERLTRVPGSSAVFVGGVIAYSNHLKTELLGVPAVTLAEHGAVSEAAALAMVRGVLDRLDATAAVSITGVAGPGGGTPDKPVGTVWLGFGVRGTVEARRVGLPGSRQEIRARATQAALFGLWRRLRGSRAD